MFAGSGKRPKITLDHGTIEGLLSDDGKQITWDDADVWKIEPDLPVNLMMPPGGKLGLRFIMPLPGAALAGPLRIQAVIDDGEISRWNKSSVAGAVVRPGDEIVEVNGDKGDLRQSLKVPGSLRLLVRQAPERQVVEEIAFDERRGGVIFKLHLDGRLDFHANGVLCLRGVKQMQVADDGGLVLSGSATDASTAEKFHLHERDGGGLEDIFRKVKAMFDKSSEGLQGTASANFPGHLGVDSPRIPEVSSPKKKVAAKKEASPKKEAAAKKAAAPAGAAADEVESVATFADNATARKAAEEAASETMARQISSDGRAAAERAALIAAEEGRKLEAELAASETMARQISADGRAAAERAAQIAAAEEASRKKMEAEQAVAANSAAPRRSVAAGWASATAKPEEVQPKLARKITLADGPTKFENDVAEKEAHAADTSPQQPTVKRKSTLALEHGEYVAGGDVHNAHASHSIQTSVARVDSLREKVKVGTVSRASRVKAHEHEDTLHATWRFNNEAGRSGRANQGLIDSVISQLEGLPANERSIGVLVEVQDEDEVAYPTANSAVTALRLKQGDMTY